jgi:hypothetical protein
MQPEITPSMWLCASLTRLKLTPVDIIETGRHMQYISRLTDCLQDRIIALGISHVFLAVILLCALVLLWDIAGDHWVEMQREIKGLRDVITMIEFVYDVQVSS